MFYSHFKEITQGMTLSKLKKGSLAELKNENENKSGASYNMQCLLATANGCGCLKWIYMHCNDCPVVEFAKIGFAFSLNTP